jgi:hypothetical protein
VSSPEYMGIAPIVFSSKMTGKKIEVPAPIVIGIVAKANNYLLALEGLFKELDFPIYRTLGQRNLSGFIGEVFSRVFAREVQGFVINPHADGRPDLLDVSTEEALQYYRTKCFVRSKDESLAPNKSLLAPFKYGGIEVKASIGNPPSDYRTRLKEDGNSEGFSVGVPRVKYLSSITYWGHHRDCDNLLGLYYDYYHELNGAPQIVAAMHAELDPSRDWGKVSIGKPGSKKTSNTSLSSSGVEKVLRNPVVVRNDPVYLEKLRGIGLAIR